MASEEKEREKSFMRQVLNVAEKPSVAKEVSRILAGGSQKTMDSESKYNPVFQFDFKLQQQPVSMLFTSVTGHIISTKFENKYKNWSSFNPSELLDQSAEIIRYIDPDKIAIEKNLLKWARNSDMLILWLDCDREGEAIAYEVIDICSKSNRNLEIKRAWFSSLDKMNITNAINNLRNPKKELSEAVNARIEIDLRIGAAFTVFQTINLQKSFQSLKDKKEPISYGPCQFPTLGFVVDRYNQIQKFSEESFWYIQPTYQWKEGTKILSTDLKWKRGRIYDKEIASALYLQAVDDEKGDYNPRGVVVSKNESDTKKLKPFPLSTVDLTKQGCRLLQMGSERIMHVAESLYQNGYISYPRTETTKYPETMQNSDIMNLVRNQKQSAEWGFYVNDLVDGQQFQRPREGKHDDKAHPPIHPIKLADKAALKPEEWKVYEFIARHFLATCGKDALGAKTEVEIKFNDEIFHADGLVVKAKNYMNVWTFEKWNDSIVPPLEVGQVIIPTKILLMEGKTTPPKLLSESELIDMMNKNGIGTDATMHDHIQTIQKRNYATKNRFMFTPTPLGLALCNAYDSLGFTLSKPNLRAKMERLMTGVAEGVTTKSIVINEVMEEMKVIYNKMEENRVSFIKSVGDHLSEANSVAADETSPGSLCGTCGNTMDLQVTTFQRQLACSSCNKIHSLPKNGEISFKDHRCPLCDFQVVEIKTDKSTYSVCPSCYSNPPDDFLAANPPAPQNQNSVYSRIQMACYKCLNKECTISGGLKNLPLYECPCCRSPVTLKETKAEKKPFLGCSGYPACTWSVFLPSDVTQLSPSGEECVSCKSKGIKSMLVDVKFEQGGMYSQICGQNQVCFHPGCNQSLVEAGVKFKEITQVVNKNGQAPFSNNNNNNSNNFRNNNNKNQSSNNSNYNKNQYQNNQFSKNPQFLEFNNKATQNNPTTPQAFAADKDKFSNNNSKIVCYTCHQPGHTSPNCPQNAKNNSTTQATPAKTQWAQKINQQQNNSNYAQNSVSTSQFATQDQEQSQFSHFTCYGCGQKGHLKNQCPQEKSANTFTKSSNTVTQAQRQAMDQDSDDMDQKTKRQQKKCELCGALRHTKNSECPNKKQ